MDVGTVVISDIQYYEMAGNTIMTNSLIRKTFLNRWLAFLHDLVWIPIVIGLAYWLRFNFDSIPPVYFSGFTLFTMIAIPVQGVTFWFVGLYKGMWRFASIPDLFRIIKAVFVGALLLTGILAIMTRLVGIPRSVLFLYPLLLIGGLSLPRLIYRWYKDKHFSLQTGQRKNVAIVGAGKAGELLLRDLRNHNCYQIVGFFDDDSAKRGRDIHGVPVLGSLEELEEVVLEYGVEEIFVAIPSASRRDILRIVDFVDASGVSVRILPSLDDLDKLRPVGSQLRPLSVEDLLGREQIKIDYGAIKEYLAQKVVLVTGAGGSIGSELCRQIGKLAPDKLILFENGEFNLYAIELELKDILPTLELIVILGDVKNIERVDWVFRKFHPEIVFHAAAYKHVPMLELNPAEGVQNNVGGTRVIAEAAQRYGADKFVLVSTDKAVNPANVMGATKRVAELFCQNLNGRCGTSFITTRFGNVLGSTGSVVPLFQKQIEKGGPVTVTHPEIKRYFMTIPEAVSLILQAGAIGVGGEIFVLDMGELVLIRELAEQMIRLEGFEPGEDVEICYTGLRPGEKLYEELLHEDEGLLKTDHPKLFLAHSRVVEWDWLGEELNALQESAVSRDINLVKKHLQYIVPEYCHKENGLYEEL